MEIQEVLTDTSGRAAFFQVSLQDVFSQGDGFRCRFLESGGFVDPVLVLELSCTEAQVARLRGSTLARPVFVFGPTLGLVARINTVQKPIVSLRANSVTEHEAHIEMGGAVPNTFVVTGTCIDFVEIADPPIR